MNACMTRGALAAATAFAVSGVLAGSTHEATISGMRFAPENVTVQLGETVTWKNGDLVPHTVTAPGTFDSGNIAPGRSFSRRMEQPGVFEYVCTYHPGMKAKVTVR